jgi:hypothetical protein
MRSGTRKRDTFREPNMEWSGPRPRRIWRWLPWQDIASLLGFCVIVAVFTYLFMWGMSGGVFAELFRG